MAAALAAVAAGCARPASAPADPSPSAAAAVGAATGTPTDRGWARGGPGAAASAATSAALAAEGIGPDTELLGQELTLAGEEAFGPTALLRSAARDAVVVFFRDRRRGQAQVGWWIALDAPSDRVMMRAAWSVALTADGLRLVYGAPHRLGDDAPRLAERLGVSAAELAAASFADPADGSRAVVQPVVVELASGHERPLPLTGGAELALVDGQLIGLARPAGTAGGERPRRLDPDAGAWLPLDPVQQRAPSTALAAPPPTESVSTRDCKRRGDTVAQTSDGRLRLLVVAPCLTVRPARLRPR